MKFKGYLKGQPELPNLNAEQLIETLRTCAAPNCAKCILPNDDYHCPEVKACQNALKRQSADMLEKLIKKEGNQNDHPTL